ncbi:hypothetical protein FMUND_15788, partial [Fusarium mundagurra]
MVYVYVTKWVSLCVGPRLELYKMALEIRGWVDERRGVEGLGTAPNPESDLRCLRVLVEVSGTAVRYI